MEHAPTDARLVGLWDAITAESVKHHHSINLLRGSSGLKFTQLMEKDRRHLMDGWVDSAKRVLPTLNIPAEPMSGLLDDFSAAYDDYMQERHGPAMEPAARGLR